MDFVEELLDAEVDNVPVLRSNIELSLAQSRGDGQGPSTDALLALLMIEAATGSRVRAVGIAERIWETGASLENPAHEALYINALIDLALIEMAAVLLKPRIEKLVDNAAQYGPLFMKFALATGSLGIMEKVAAQTGDGLMADFAATCRILEYGEHFKQIQRIVLGTVKDYLCEYNFDAFDERGFTDVGVVMRLSATKAETEALSRAMNENISAYCAAKGIKKLNNLTIMLDNFVG